jgi:hypothetical protein
LHSPVKARRLLRPWLAALLGSGALLAALPALSRAEESNPNNYSCVGAIAAGAPEPGSEDQQVKYAFYCNGPITGYQVQPQIPATGISSPPTVTNAAGAPLSDTFSCSGEIPGYGVNCVGVAKAGYETITGQFAIGSKLCAEPRVDPLLTVTYAYLEKGVLTQAISGPFDLGRPHGCAPDALSGSTRLNPKAKAIAKKHGKRRRAATGHRARRR